MVVSELDRNDIRQDWINAVFGRDFYASTDYQPTRQGIGDAGIPSYVTYSVTIPANAMEQRDKVGVTLSNISLGLYVRELQPKSQAQLAGVKEGSILLDINGIGMLGEPSRQALERIWQYEGYTREDLNQSHFVESKHISNAHYGYCSMRFFRKGQTYSVIFFNNGPYGISWATCGNFALVQKSYSIAETAGVLRGSIIAAVNSRSIRTMDHESAAAEIRDLFVQGQAIQITCCYTPAQSRSGFAERDSKSTATNTSIKAQSPRKKNVIASADGVQVRRHSQEYHPFWYTNNKTHENGHHPTRLEVLMSELAARVISGEMEAPTTVKAAKALISTTNPTNTISNENLVSRSVISFRKCPLLSKEELISKWNPIDALLTCMQAQRSDFDDAQLADLINSTKEQSSLEILQTMLRDERWLMIAKSVMLQLVSCMCHNFQVVSPEGKNDLDDQSDFGKAICAMLLETCRQDEEFCQHVYFLLLSYIATFETLREKETSRFKLTHALERLYSAQRQLESQLAPECERNGLTCSEADCHSRHNTPDLLEISKSTESASSDTKSSHSTSVKKPTLLLKIFKKSKNNTKTKHASLARHEGGNDTVPTKDKLSSIAAVVPSSPKPMDLKERLSTFSYFLKDLDEICDAIERSLLKSISQKIADWALQPWSASKESELAKVTDDMRKGLKNIMASSQTPLRIINPIETQERLISIDSDESYILPSAHFPLLLTFDAQVVKNGDRMVPSYHGSPFKSEFIYKTTIEILSIHEINSPSQISQGEAYCVQAAVAGVVQQSAKSSPSGNQAHQWASGGNLTFLTRSCWGPPQTLSLGISRASVNGNNNEALQSVGHCWVDMKSMWETILAKESLSTPYTENFTAKAWSLELTESFDSNGNISGEMAPAPGNLEIELRITNQQIGVGKHMNGSLTRKRMLLYKHDDDLRQEMFTIQLINLCDSLLKQSGLDMKLITFRCIPVGCKRGFIEWIPGSVPLSDICQSCPGSIFARSCSEESVVRKSEVLVEVRDPLSEVAKAGLLNYQSLPHSPTKPKTVTCGEYNENSLVNNPIQDFFRSTAYDPNAPYFIQKKVMDTYVKSCAGYSVITYILGIGDRHLDNLLLHQNGYLFHCDYSFILGKDPKKYLPLRITEQMIHGMGGRESDNFSRFLSLAGAAFVALRRHENARLILAMARLMTPSILPDICLNQKPEQALDGIHERLRLDLSDEDAITYIERIIEESASSKLWVAVDALHVIGKRF